MATAIDLVDLGMASPQALYLGFQLGDLAGVGTSNTGAAQTGAKSFINLTTASGQTACILPASAPYDQPIVIFVASSDAGLVFPPAGQSINGGTATTGSVSIAQNKVRAFWRYDATNWWSILTA